MMRHLSIKRALAIPAVLALAATTAFLAAAPARAAAATYCDGVIEDTTVEGDLIVPEGYCGVRNVTVNGSLILLDSAWTEADVDGGEIKRGIKAGAHSTIVATGTTVRGDITATNAFRVFIDGSTVYGDFVGRDRSERPTDEDATQGVGFELSESRMYGDIITTAPELSDDNIRVSINDSYVTGDLTTYRSATGIYTSTIRGDVSVTRGFTWRSHQWGLWKTYHSVVASNIYGDARWDQAEGDEYPDTYPEVEQSYGLKIDRDSYFSKDVTITNATGRVGVFDAIIEGKLSGTGNAYTPWGERNEVRGGIEGQFTEMTPPPSN